MSQEQLEERRARLVADCSRCAALCCVIPTFTRSSDFAIDKPAGTPCPNLLSTLRCGIHTELRPRGFPGCTVYDCFGAGQYVTEVTFGGHDWRTSPDVAEQMAEVFAVVRILHELMRYAAEAAAFVVPPRDFLTVFSTTDDVSVVPCFFFFPFFILMSFFFLVEV